MNRHRAMALGFAACLAATAGCGWSRSPYADDPLVQKGRAVPGTDRVAGLCSADRPAPPAPPADSGNPPPNK